MLKGAKEGGRDDWQGKCFSWVLDVDSNVKSWSGGNKKQGVGEVEMD